MLLKRTEKWHVLLLNIFCNRHNINWKKFNNACPPAPRAGNTIKIKQKVSELE